MVAQRSAVSAQPAAADGNGHRDGAPLPLVRAELLPDGANYRDTGCELSPSCLRCPLPRCKYDSRSPVSLVDRDREIVALRRRHVPARTLARIYGVSVRNIYRICAAAAARQHRAEDIEGVMLSALPLGRPRHLAPAADSRSAGSPRHREDPSPAAQDDSPQVMLRPSQKAEASPTNT